MLNALLDRLNRTSLVLQIVIALVLGGLVAWLAPAAAQPASLLGTLFISALKAVAPVLVFLLVIAAISNHRPGQETQMRGVLALYLVGTLCAAMVGVLASIVGEKVTFLAVCGKEAVARGVKAGDLVKTVSAVCGGKGGGKPDSAMGGGTELLKVDDALASVDDFVSEKLS